MNDYTSEHLQYYALLQHGFQHSRMGTQGLLHLHNISSCDTTMMLYQATDTTS